MIRLLRIISTSNRMRFTKCPIRQLCSSKSDDSTVKMPDAVTLDDVDTKSELSSTLSDKKKLYNKYPIEKNNAILYDLLNALPSNPNDVSVDALIDFYQKVSGNLLITPNVTKYPKFTVLREATRIHLPKLNTKELKHMFVAILPSKQIMHDKLSKMIVDAFLKRVYYMPFDQILFVDFMLHKYFDSSELSKDYNILRLKLQTIFLSKFEDFMNEIDDFEVLMKIVSYCGNNIEIVSSKIANSVTTSLLLNDDDSFSVNHITSILIMLSSLGKLNEYVEKLLQKMFRLWCQTEVTPTQVFALLSVLAANRARIDRDRFNNREFIQHCVNVVIKENDKKLSFNVQNKLTNLGFESQELIDHLSTYFGGNLRELGIVNYIIMCRACAKTSYKPPNWDSTILKAMKTFKFGFYLTALRNFDWAEFVLDLEKLGYCDTDLLYKIIHSKYFQSQKCYDSNKMNRVREILERKSVKVGDTSDLSDDDSSSDSSDSDYISSDDESPLYDDLTKMFGVTKVWRNFRLDKKLTIPFVLKMDLRNGDFLPFSSITSMRYISDHELVIGIAVVPDGISEKIKLKFARKQARRMQRNGISSIILEESKWNSLKAYEKSLVFYTKIVDMMELYRKNKIRGIV